MVLILPKGWEQVIEVESHTFALFEFALYYLATALLRWTFSSSLCADCIAKFDENYLRTNRAPPKIGRQYLKLIRGSQ
jgi:hypothetical protein